MNSKIDKKGPAVKFPPPLIFLSLLITSYGAHQALPLGLGISPQAKFIGVAVALVGMLILLLTLISFLRAKTSIEPWKPTTKIITTGLYAWSRNPIYAAFCLIPIGCGIFINSLWVLLSFIPSALLVYYIAIRKEEVYLEEKFGEEYLRYKRKVRRWL